MAFITILAYVGQTSWNLWRRSGIWGSTFGIYHTKRNQPYHYMSIGKLWTPVPVGCLMCVTRVENHVDAVHLVTNWLPDALLIFRYFLFVFRAVAIVSFTRNPEENLLNVIIFHIRSSNKAYTPQIYN
jgi:hypothetical protein